jgi:hypothetical protein
MRKIKQNKFGKEGNCLEACIASLLEIDINIIPCYKKENWNILLNVWLIKNYGYYILPLSVKGFFASFQKLMKDTLYIASGYSKRGLFHATIWKNNKMIFDPHPSNIGIKEIEAIDFLIKYFK